MVCREESPIQKHRHLVDYKYFLHEKLYNECRLSKQSKSNNDLLYGDKSTKW